MGLFDRLRGNERPRVAPTPPPRKVTKIQRPVLELICEASRSTHPNEFIAALRTEGDTLTELLIVAAHQGPVHALPKWNAMPTGRDIVGTVHSHPSGVPFPSDADKQFFSHYGHTHIIIAEPYRDGTWRAWDHNAQPVRLDVVEA